MPRQLTLNLTKRSDGRYVKKIDGRIVYFGSPGCSVDEARRDLIAFLARKRVDDRDGHDLTLKQLAELYKAHCVKRVSVGDMRRKTWIGYETLLRQAVATFPKATKAAMMTPRDFDKLRLRWAHAAPDTVARYIIGVKTMFRWAVAHGLMTHEPPYGPRFIPPASKAKRQARALRLEVTGVKHFSTDELATLLSAADTAQRAAILFALNTGCYPVDLEAIRWDELRGGMLDTLRIKSNSLHRSPLWPETIAALNAIDRRQAGPFTVYKGQRPNADAGWNAIGNDFRRLAKSCGVSRTGRGLSAMKHTLVRSIGDHPDRIACLVVRGHVIESIDEHYDLPTRERLESVTNQARQRLGIQRLGLPTADALERELPPADALAPRVATDGTPRLRRRESASDASPRRG